MAEDQVPQHVRRSCLGRMAMIGELYDVRSESLSSLSLFKKSTPDNLISVIDLSDMKLEYKFTENLSDRFELIDIEAELQMNILLGVIKLEGSGEFLNHEKKSEKSVSISLVSKLLTVHEKLFTSLQDIIQNIDMQILQITNYTHLITEITWGANCLMNLEFSCNSGEKKEEIRGRLAAELTKLKAVTVSGAGELEKESLNSFQRENVKIKVFADVLPENDWPTTPESFIDFVKSFPKLLAKVNNGKGKPMKLVMIPLSTIRKLAKLEVEMDNLIGGNYQSLLMSTIYFFEGIGQMKQKLYDFHVLLKENKNYVKEEDLREAADMEKQLSMKESDLKASISEEWELVKSGKKALKDLIRDIERLKMRTLNLLDYEDYLESCTPILQKLSTVKTYTSQGIIYLGRGETFQSLQVDHPDSEFIVLVTSTEIENADLELSRKTHLYFVSLVKSDSPNIKYVVVDFDFKKEKEFLNRKITTIKCFHLKGLNVINRDMMSSYIAEMDTNYAAPKADAKYELCEHKPANRVPLEMVCPGFESGTCSSNTLTWICYNCKGFIEYGFDQNYYCSCGKNSATAFNYRCSQMKHGSVFIPAKETFLKTALSKLRPLKEMNVLIIGQSGVGKSTWINSIVNYLSYNSLEEAQENGVICTIPIGFTVHDPKTFEEKLIQVGTKSDNEVTDTGFSATQSARTYRFFWGERCVRIIDTPGMGDCRGIYRDKDNLACIIDHLGYLKELHGVCILLRANDNKLNAFFKYCIKELLTHLHKSITKNIVFCFTNSRTAMYAPGDAALILRKLIEDLGISNELPLGRHNMFPLDNEAFLFLCSLSRNDIHYDEVVKASYSKSWDVSLNETMRLFKTIKTFQPHLLEETITLVKARNKILSFTKPLAEISKTIQLNISSIEAQKKEIEESKNSIENLKKNLRFTEITLETKPLDRPRTVCTRPSCVNYIEFQGFKVKEIEYKTHCHDDCRLTKVTPLTVKNILLKECLAMENDVCKVCGCGYEHHMHITYSQTRVEVEREREEIKNIMEEKTEGLGTVQKLLAHLENRVSQYKGEQEEIIKATAKLGMFLRKNAIAPFNDSIVEYLKYLIDEEKKKVSKTKAEEEVLENLQATLERYKKEVNILSTVLNKETGENDDISLESVNKIEKNLYSLELMGESIQKCVKENQNSSGRAMEYSEVPIEIAARPETRKNKDQESLLAKAKALINKIRS